MENGGMEQVQAQPQVQPQVQAQPQAQPSSNGIMDITLKNIVYAVVGGAIVGFSIGVGFLIAQKIIGKNFDKKDEPKANLSNFDGNAIKMPMKRPMRNRSQMGSGLNGGRLF